MLSGVVRNVENEVLWTLKPTLPLKAWISLGISSLATWGKMFSRVFKAEADFASDCIRRAVARGKEEKCERGPGWGLTRSSQESRGQMGSEQNLKRVRTEISKELEQDDERARTGCSG